ncbi:hypothetical protein DFH28DRAFT_1162660 [Melampsora americana]|nr:hypothetical protein DFH28DRAFT_1162660 [Melampsora americana]
MSNQIKFPTSPIINSNYKLVKEFSNETEETEEEEWEEEVNQTTHHHHHFKRKKIEYLTLDLGSSLDKKTFSPNSNFQLLALHSSHPILKIGNQFFKGTHEDLIGTELIMKRSSSESSPPDSKPSYDPLISLTKRIRFTPIDLQPKSDLNPSSFEEAHQPIVMRHWANRRMKKKNTMIRRTRKKKSIKDQPELIIAEGEEEEVEEEERTKEVQINKSDGLDHPSDLPNPISSSSKDPLKEPNTSS